MNKDQLDTLFQYAFSLCKNEDEAYDLLHSSIERFLKKRGILNVQAYLRKSIRNAWLDSKKVSVDIAPFDEEMNLVEGFQSLETIVINENQLSKVWTLLTAEEREILYYWAVLEYSIDEISFEQNIPKGTILSRIHRMRKRLKEKSLRLVEVSNV